MGNQVYVHFNRLSIFRLVESVNDAEPENERDVALLWAASMGWFIDLLDTVAVHASDTRL